MVDIVETPLMVTIVHVLQDLMELTVKIILTPAGTTLALMVDGAYPQ